jgi:uncharacterized membrane protein
MSDLVAIVYPSGAKA